MTVSYLYISKKGKKGNGGKDEVTENADNVLKGAGKRAKISRTATKLLQQVKKKGIVAVDAREEVQDAERLHLRLQKMKEIPSVDVLGSKSAILAGAVPQTLTMESADSSIALASIPVTEEIVSLGDVCSTPVVGLHVTDSDSDDVRTGVPKSTSAVGVVVVTFLIVLKCICYG